jgi:hypothetical protein
MLLQEELKKKKGNLIDCQETGWNKSFCDRSAAGTRSLWRKPNQAS